MSSRGTNIPSSRQKRDRGGTPAPGAAAAWYDSPIWLLDRWDYEIAIRKTREFPAFAERANDVEEVDNLAWVRRTQTRETSMLRLEDGVALAALCGDPVSSPSMEGDLELILDRRDVALAVAMAKMIAFLPFRGVRANPNKKGRLLISDYDGVVCKTPIEEALGLSLEALERCVWMSRGGFGALHVEYAAAAGALGNIAMVHHLAVVLMRAHSHRSEPILTAFVQGAVTSDNASSLELLFRFPPPGWEDIIANYFHLSNSPKPLLLRQFYWDDIGFAEPVASLAVLSLRQEKYWPHCYAQIMPWETFQILLTSFSDEMWGNQDYCPSAFHARLVSIILTKKSFLGRGSIAFPADDVAILLAVLVDRVPLWGHCWMGGRKLSELDLRVMTLEQQPEDSLLWQDVGMAMPYGASVSIRIDGESKVMTEVDVAVKSLEQEIAGTKSQDRTRTRNTIFRRWRNLALACSPTQHVTVAGDTCSRFDCVHKALTGMLGTGEPFKDSWFGWLAAGVCLLTCSSGGNVTPETHFTDAKTGKTFDRIECILVSLGIFEGDERSWVVLGYALGERERMREPEDPETPPTTSTVLVPSSITETTFSFLDESVVGKCSLVEVSGDAASDVKGAGGKNGPCGPCSEFYGLSELDCYNIALAFSEFEVLRFLAKRSLQILQRFVQVVTRDRLSVKGRQFLDGL